MDEHTSHELAYKKGYEAGKRDAVKHGHKVVVERHRGIAYALDCPICGGKFPSNMPYSENVEYCSVCGKKLDDTFQNFCPNCGADMREPPKGE